MSTSDPAGAPGGTTTRLVVQAPPDTEVFLIDYTFQLVDRSVGTLTRAVAPGIYKVKYRRGDVERTVTTVVSGSADVSVPLPDVFERRPATAGTIAPLSMAAPGPPSTPTAPPDVPGEAAPAAAATKTAPATSGAWLEIGGAAEAGAAHPADGLSIRDASGALVVDLAAVMDAPAPGGSAATSYAVALAPGSYRLRAIFGEQQGGDGRGLEQSLVICEGWQTQVLLRTRNYGTADRPLWGADLANATMLMARPGELVDDDMRSYADLVKSWVAGPHVTIAAAHAEKISASATPNPSFAIAVAHTIVRGAANDRFVGRPESPDARRLVGAIVDAIDPLVPGHPDVAALALWLGRPARVSFALPPMLLNSWVLVSAAAAERASLVPRGSLSSLIADRLWASALWLVWRYDETLQPAVKGRWSRAGALDELVSRVQGHGKGDAVLTDLERGLYEALKDLSGAAAEGTERSAAVRALRAMPTTAARGVSMRLAKRLGVPAASIDHAMASLLDKLKT